MSSGKGRAMADYSGNPKVNPDNHTVNGYPIKGWVLEKQSGDMRLRCSIELYQPTKPPPGQVARPLTYADDLPPRRAAPTAPPAARASMLPEPRPAPPMPPVAAPNSGHAPNPKLAELRRACKMNLNMGNKVIPIDFVLKCLED